MPKDQELNLHLARLMVFYYSGRCQTSLSRTVEHFSSGSRPQDSTREYSHWFKGMSLVLTLMSHALQGNYVNFGVFNLYNDQALSSSLQVSLQVLLSMKLAEIMAYPKVCGFSFSRMTIICYCSCSHDSPTHPFLLLYSQVTKAYYQFLNCIFRYHLDTIVMVDSNTFLKLIDAFQRGT